MASSRCVAEKVQGKPETYRAQKQDMSKWHRNQFEGAPTGQIWASKRMMMVMDLTLNNNNERICECLVILKNEWERDF